MIIQRISTDTGLSVEDLRSIAVSANYRYKLYRISKRRGGSRIICHPTPVLKFLQRWLNRNIFGFLPIHDAASAYRRGVGVVENARMHASSRYFLKMDLKDFFPSLTIDDVKNVIRANFPKNVMALDDGDLDVIGSIVCRKGALTIGAPSSPVLSNAIMYDFDCFVVDLCRNLDVNYSRYADDMFFSCNLPNVLSDIYEGVRRDLRHRDWPNLRVNERKTVYSSKKRRRVATGVVLTPNGELSIGRKMKRKIRTLTHLYSKGNLSQRDVSFLRGYLAYVNYVEPRILVGLRRKFGKEVLDNLFLEKAVIRK